MDTPESRSIFKSRDQVPPDAAITDTFPGAVRELFYAHHPEDKLSGRAIEEKSLAAFMSQEKIGDAWIYYPWNKTAVRTLDEDHYYFLRTYRNRNIITAAEQKKFRECTVGVGGLSVGSAIISALVLSGGPKYLKIADPDAIEISNLNRIQASLRQAGAPKIVVAAQRIWELDPFAEITMYPNGIVETGLSDFFAAKPAINIFIDQMDNMRMKIKTRLYCREHRIPVIMATDNGEGIMVDVERFDLEPNREIFHGWLADFDMAQIDSPGFHNWLEVAIKIIRNENVDAKVRRSLPEIGKTLAAVPQLGIAATMAGAAVAVAVKKIANNENLRSGRHLFNIDDFLTS